MCDRQSVRFVPFLRGETFIHSAANSLRDLRRSKRKDGLNIVVELKMGLEVICMYRHEITEMDNRGADRETLVRIRLSRARARALASVWATPENELYSGRKKGESES